MDKLKITINGQAIEAAAGKTILEAAQENNIQIPTLCYLKHLSPVGACRMCIVEVEKMRKVATACTTPITQGMVIKTDTPKLKELRRMTLELLFSERNHFCPFCIVSGGDCELQKLGYAHNMDHIRYDYLYPNLPTDISHPYFMLDHSRCILCSRCVRYCDEIEGVHTLDFSMRGGKSVVTVDLHQSFENSSCTSCGGCVQVCPTGAFTDKLSAFRGKTVNTQITQTICQQCSLGCGITVSSKGKHIIRIDGDTESKVNHGHLCIKGRYEPLLNHKDRIMCPSVFQNGKAIEFSWDKALDQIASRLKRLKTKSPEQIRGIISPQATNESIYMFMKLFRETLKTESVDLLNRYEYHSLVKAFDIPNSNGIIPDIESDISKIEESDCIVIFGADVGRTHKVLASRIRSRVRKNNVQLVTINLRKAELDEISNIAVRIKSKTDGILLNTLIQLILDSNKAKGNPDISEEIKAEFEKYTPEIAESKTGIAWEKILQISRIITRSENPVFIYGRGLTNQNKPDLFATLIQLARLVGKPNPTQLPLIGLRHGANSRGAFEMDLLMMSENPNANKETGDPFEKIDPEVTKFLYLVLGDDEIQWSEKALEILSKIDFLVVHTSYPSKVLDYAKVVLPSPVWYEKSGTMKNTQGEKQSLKPIFSSVEDVKDNWLIFAELEKRLSNKTQAASLEQIQKEIDKRLTGYRKKLEPVVLENLPFRCISFLEEGK